MNRSNVHLLEAMQNGQEQVIEDFYADYRRAFLKWSEKTFGLSYDEAADIYQDAIIVVYEKATSGKLTVLESSLKTYLFAVGKNLILKALRKREVTQAALVEEYRTEQGDGMEEIVEQRREKVRTIMATLPDPCRSILQMYYYQKFSMRVIASRMGYRSEDVAKVQKNRCMKSLRSTMLHLLSKSE